MCSSGSELRPNEYEILYHLARVGEDYQSSIAKAIKGKKSARKSLNKYYRYLEDEGLIRVSKEEAVKKYYKITHDGFQHLLEKWPLETVINSTERVLEEADSNFEKSVDIEGIRFHFIVDGCFGIRIENGFGKPDVPENPISADSDYVYKYLQPIRDTKLDGQLILNKLRENSLDTLDEILLVYTPDCKW
ncbi:hypothetical protein AKJ38_03155 [candidate division MSBL1 archaeon SCGC-AAA259I14]|uniref:Uncharacterized protein n=2 Tax=candidate division MSBL1 TaxID=215777 RepID=A0A133UQK0_9EURY|nr:hypothetical protein AKJ66_04180 [candidate division MSBL1 archaeon SCGC-AAA259E22]KXA96524.1 hypothetical protein AKJ38_03155 [candidate division MSBL1 archaeon SCGC-AAA259I14]